MYTDSHIYWLYSRSAIMQCTNNFTTDFTTDFTTNFYFCRRSADMQRTNGRTNAVVC